MLWEDNSLEAISNTAVYKFLGFEQILKNSLTVYPISGSKEGVIQICYFFELLTVPQEQLCLWHHNLIVLLPSKLIPHVVLL